MTLLDLAMRHQASRSKQSDRVARSVVALWRTIDPARLDEGWALIASRVGALIAQGQFQAATQATVYANATASVQGMTVSEDQVVPAAFAGATLEGREVAPEAFGAVTTTKQLVGRGLGVGAAFAAGTGFLSVMAAQMVRDAGNAADKVAAISNRTVSMLRVIQPGACSRCAILAGIGHFTRHFERHPGCRCTTIAVPSNTLKAPEGFFAEPSEYFESLTPAEQDRVFTKAGAEAIRLGADPVRVVNSRRGMYSVKQPAGMVARAQPRTVIGPDGVPFQAYTTVEGTGRRRGNLIPGVGQRARFAEYDANTKTRSVRLMPETIIDQAGGDVEKAVDLLRQYGYIR